MLHKYIFLCMYKFHVGLNPPDVGFAHFEDVHPQHISSHHKNLSSHKPTHHMAMEHAYNSTC